MQQSRQYTSPASFAALHLRESLWGFFSIEAREYFPHAVPPLTSYKWSKLHRCMKIVLCKISTQLFRYTLGQGNAAIPSSKLSGVLNYPTSIPCILFFGVHQSHIFKFYSAAEFGTMKQHSRTQALVKQSNNATITVRQQELATLELLALTFMQNN